MILAWDSPFNFHACLYILHVKIYCIVIVL